MAFSDSLRALAASLLAMVRNRLELATVELEEEAQRMFSYLLHSLVAFFFLGLCCTLLTVLVLVIFWDTHRIAALLVLATICGALGIRIGLVARQNYLNKPRMMNDTLSELQKDMAALRAASKDQH